MTKMEESVRERSYGYGGGEREEDNAKFRIFGDI